MRDDLPSTAFRIVALITLGLALTHCGHETRDLENYGDIQSRPQREVLTEDHRGGYGRNQCLVCHNAALNLHRGPHSDIDPEALNQAYRERGEVAFCMSCHGTNGTSSLSIR